MTYFDALPAHAAPLDYPFARRRPRSTGAARTAVRATLLQHLRRIFRAMAGSRKPERLRRAAGPDQAAQRRP